MIDMAQGNIKLLGTVSTFQHPDAPPHGTFCVFLVGPQSKRRRRMAPPDTLIEIVTSAVSHNVSRMFFRRMALHGAFATANLPRHYLPLTTIVSAVNSCLFCSLYHLPCHHTSLATTCETHMVFRVCARSSTNLQLPRLQPFCSRCPLSEHHLGLLRLTQGGQL